MDFDLGAVDLVAGILARLQGRWEDAQGHLHEGLAQARKMKHPLAEVRLLDEYGRLLAAQGQKERASERFNDSLEIARRLGAKPLIEYTEKAAGSL